MLRFKVIRQWVKYKGRLWYVGELLPTTFSERDRQRNVFTSRIAAVEVPDEEVTVADAPIVSTPSVTPPAPTPVRVVKPASHVKPTGTPMPVERAKAVAAPAARPVATTAVKSISGQAK
jgi:hypothetical protein